MLGSVGMLRYECPGSITHLRDYGRSVPSRSPPTKSIYDLLSKVHLRPWPVSKKASSTTWLIEVASDDSHHRGGV
jgi:hypothetical protein